MESFSNICNALVSQSQSNRRLSPRLLTSPFFTPLYKDDVYELVKDSILRKYIHRHKKDFSKYVCSICNSVISAHREDFITHLQTMKHQSKYQKIATPTTYNKFSIRLNTIKETIYYPDEEEWEEYRSPAVNFYPSSLPHVKPCDKTLQINGLGYPWTTSRYAGGFMLNVSSKSSLNVEKDRPVKTDAADQIREPVKNDLQTEPGISHSQGSGNSVTSGEDGFKGFEDIGEDLCFFDEGQSRPLSSMFPESQLYECAWSSDCKHTYMYSAEHHDFESVDYITTSDDSIVGHFNTLDGLTDDFRIILASEVISAVERGNFTCDELELIATSVVTKIAKG